MVFIVAALILAASFWILSKAKVLEAMARAPAMMLAAGAGVSILYRIAGGPFAPSEWAATGADALLAALVFVAAAQFRLSRLASACPASFRLTLGGAPLFLVVCGLAAFILVPHLTLGAAFLVAGALTLNGAAFDRRAVADAPAPSVIKAAVRLESAAILALGLPVALFLEAAATAAPVGMPAVTPVYEFAISAFKAFALGGGLGFVAAVAGNRLKTRQRAPIAIAAGAIAAVVAALIGAHPVIAAAAAGLLWGEQTTALITTRVRMRRVVERLAAPAAYFAFGLLLAPRLLQADLLTIVFALAAVTIMRAGPRLVALKKTTLAKESQMFLAWFGGAPGAASALFLISLFDAASIVAQDAALTVGALAVTFGIIAARLTSRPLLKSLLKQTAAAKKRALFAT
jgi:NhaP-type Na+/H+ or K+/H+ antiporter